MASEYSAAVICGSRATFPPRIEGPGARLEVERRSRAICVRVTARRSCVTSPSGPQEAPCRCPGAGRTPPDPALKTVLLRFTLAPSELRRANSCKQNCVSCCLDYTYAIGPVRIARRQDCNDRYLKGVLRTSPRNEIAQVHVLQQFMQLAQPYCWTYLPFAGHLPNGWGLQDPPLMPAPPQRRPGMGEARQESWADVTPRRPGQSGGESPS